MTFKVEVGPPQIAIHHAQTVLITETNGEVGWPSDKGLYFLDTRLVSAWAIYANGEEWDLLNGGAVTAHKARIHLTNRSFPTEEIPGLPRSTVAGHSGRLLFGRWSGRNVVVASNDDDQDDTQPTAQNKAPRADDQLDKALAVLKQKAA